MVKAYVSGDYRIVPWQTIVKIIAVLIYFVSPIDLIPDVLPAIGLTDDLALILWLFNALSGDIRDFELWEKTKAELVETTINLD
ncbi:YkvA family protein [Pseudarcicella hirudinis]